MKKLLMGFLILALVTISFTSCNDTVDVPDVQMVDLSFDLENLNLTNKFDATKAAHKDVFTKEDGSTIPYPECSTEEPSFVKVMINGTEYTVDMTALPGGSTTEVIQVPAGTYEIQSFVVFGVGGDPLYAAPDVGSREVSEGGLQGLPFSVDLQGFVKTKINIDVVCWHDYSFQALAWHWYEIDYHQVKTLCFFGDVCTKFYSDFGSPDYDLVAAIRVDIYNGSELYNSVTNLVDGTFTGTEGSPLCVEYLDNLLVDEDFSFSLTLLTPTGDVILEDHTSFEDGVYSSEDGTGGFGGDDGIWNFNVGNCGNVANEANYAPYLPLPTELVDFKLIEQAGQPDGYYKLEVGGFTGNFAFAPGQYNGWCVDYDTTIYYGVQYEAKVWSLLDIASIPDETRLNRIKDHAGKLHWIINHIEELTSAGFSPKDIQDMIWWIVSAKGPASVAVKTYAAGVQSYSPKVGDMAMIIFDPYVQDDDTRVQAFGVRIDP